MKRVWKGSEGLWHVGQRITWLDSNMRGTVIGFTHGNDGNLYSVGVKCDHPGGDWMPQGFEEPEHIRPLNVLELMTEIQP